MINLLKAINKQLLFFIILILVIFLLTHDWTSSEEKATHAQLKSWANQLDQRVTPAGIYIRWESDTLPEKDAWGTPLKVYYTNESIAEKLWVKSAGADKQWNTEDDLIKSKLQINGVGIGEGIKSNTAEVAKEATKGVVVGIKETTSEAFQASKEKMGESSATAKEKATTWIQGMKDKFTQEEKE